MTRILLVSSNSETAASVSAVTSELEGFAELLVVQSASQALIEVERQDVDLVLVDEEVEGYDSVAALREISTTEPLLPVCLLSSRPSAELILRALDAGGRSVLPLPPSIEQYAERLRTLSAWTRAAQSRLTGQQEERARAVGAVIAVIGAKGGVGTSMIALSAAKIAASVGRTALVDLDLRSGDLASYCGVVARHNVTDLAALASEISGREISEVAYPIRGGIELLPAPEHGELAELMTESAARQIVQAMRYQYASVVVDCGSHLDDTTASALDLADAVVIVATPEVPALRAVRRLRESLDRLSLAQNTPFHVILNRTSRSNEIQPSAASRLVSAPLLAVMPDRAVKLEPVLNAGSIIDLAMPELDAVGRAVVSVTNPVGNAAVTIETATEEKSKARRRDRRRRKTATQNGKPSVPEATTDAGIAYGESPLNAVPAVGRTSMPPSFVPRAMPYNPQGEATAAVSSFSVLDENAPSSVPPSIPPKAGGDRGSLYGSIQQETRQGRRSLRSEQGVVTVELVGSLFLVLTVFAICMQSLITGCMYMFAHNASEEAARELGRGASFQQARSAALDYLPDSVDGHANVSLLNGDIVKVTIDMPIFVPGISAAEGSTQVRWEY